MHNQLPTSLKGQFLMAMPGLADPNFQKTVTCISEHTEEGAVGVIINRIHNALSAKMIFDELEIECRIDGDSLPIHIGGPVHANEIFVLQGPPFDWEGSLPVNSELALSNSRAVLEAIAADCGPREFIICLGCAGWGPGQLEFELKENVWLTGPYFRKLAFEVPVEKRWEEAIRSIGIDPALLSDTAGHA
jgi:putative transcriptional regulator